MPFLRKRPRRRRRANLQIDYPFDRVAYARWRLRCWGHAQLRRGTAVLRRLTDPTRAAAGAAHRRVRGIWGSIAELDHRASRGGPVAVRQADC